MKKFIFSVVLGCMSLNAGAVVKRQRNFAVIKQLR